MPRRAALRPRDCTQWPPPLQLKAQKTPAPELKITITETTTTTPFRPAILSGADLVAAPGHKNRENQEHASGVWTTKSPTGIELGEAFCEYFDHTDGKAWKTLVFNAVTQSPARPRPNAYYPSVKDKLRFYALSSRALVYVPRLAPFRSDIENTDPNERMFPTQHPFNPSRFTGTLLSLGARPRLIHGEGLEQDQLQRLGWLDRQAENPLDTPSASTSATSSRGTT